MGTSLFIKYTKASVFLHLFIEVSQRSAGTYGSNKRVIQFQLCIHDPKFP
jgi:hypothetical protein